MPISSKLFFLLVLDSSPVKSKLWEYCAKAKDDGDFADVILAKNLFSFEVKGSLSNLHFKKTMWMVLAHIKLTAIILLVVANVNKPHILRYLLGL